MNSHTIAPLPAQTGSGQLGHHPGSLPLLKTHKLLRERAGAFDENIQLRRTCDMLLDQLRDFQTALDHHAVVATTDAAGKITYVNERLCQLSKYTREELLGQDHRII